MARFPEPRAPSSVGTMADVPGAGHLGSESLEGSRLLDRYQVLRRLGEGGMGTVYLAEHTTIRKRLAIKVLAEQFATNRDLRERFLQEARSASMIRQQNIVEITDFGSTDDGLPFFVMEFLEGEDLAKTIEREGPLAWTRVQHVMLQICSALEAAHERGIVHRDMKPENCFRVKRGSDENFIKVLDFGIAKVMHNEEEGAGEPGSSTSLTRTGMVLGTPEYMSPEQASGLDIDHRADIYAAGCIMYELLTGSAPFGGKTFMAILSKHMFEPPQSPLERNPSADVTPAIEAVVLKALQKDPIYRFQSMAEFAEAIVQAGTGTVPVEVVKETITQPPVGLTTFSGTTAEGMFVEERRKRDYKVAILGAIALSLAGALAFVLFFNDKGDDERHELVQADDSHLIAAPPELDPKSGSVSDTKHVEPGLDVVDPDALPSNGPEAGGESTGGESDVDEAAGEGAIGAVLDIKKKKKKGKKNNKPDEAKTVKTKTETDSDGHSVRTLKNPELSNPFGD